MGNFKNILLKNKVRGRDFEKDMKYGKNNTCVQLYVFNLTVIKSFLSLNVKTSKQIEKTRTS